MMNAKKLGKLAMPGPKKQIEDELDFSEMDASSDDAPMADELDMSSLEEGNPDDMAQPSQLEGIPDEELMAELEARGLIDEMGNAVKKEEAPAEDMPEEAAGEMEADAGDDQEVYS